VVHVNGDQVCIVNKNYCSIKFEVFTAITMKNAVFWDVTPCGSCEPAFQKIVTLPSSPVLVTLIMEALLSSETSLLTRATRRNIPEDCILELLEIHYRKY
jgi:hypothetical protein